MTSPLKNNKNKGTTSLAMMVRGMFYAFFLIFLIFLTLRYKDNIVHIIETTKWWWVIMAVFCHIPFIGLGGLTFEQLCKRFSVYLRWQDWLGLSFVANLLNQLLPYRPGMGFRYLYLKKRYDMKASIFFHVMLMYFLLLLSINSLLVLFAWLFSNLPAVFNHYALLALLIGASMFAFFMLLSKLNLSTRLPTFIHNSVDAMKQLAQCPKTVLRCSFTLFLASLFSAITFYFLFIGVDFPIAFIHCLFLSGIVNLAMIFPVTPGNIGVLEMLIGTLTQVIYGDFSIGFSVTALYRMTQWVPSIILGSGFSLTLAGSFFPTQKALNAPK